jgi:RNA recognition motif-containing protein
VDQPTRYAFVEFNDPRAAATAVTLSGTEIEGRHLKVTMSHSAITSPPSASLRDGKYSISNYSRERAVESSKQSNNNSLSASSSSLNAISVGGGNNSGIATAVIQPPIAADAVERTIYVTSIDSQIMEHQLIDYFTYCGHINTHRLCGDDSHPTRFAFFEFSTREAAVAALSMNGTSLGRFSIKVSPSRTAIQPGTGPTSKAINYNTPHYQDQIARTVYVGGVDVNVTEDDLQEFFQEACGPVVKVALAGDSDHASRFAFIEFADGDARNKALSKSGTILASKTIRISASRTPILNGGKVYSADGTTYANQTGYTDDDLKSQMMGHYPPPPSSSETAISDVSASNEEQQNGFDGYNLLDDNKPTDTSSDDYDPWETQPEQTDKNLKRKRSNAYHSDEDEEKEDSNDAKRARYNDYGYSTTTYNTYDYYQNDKQEDDHM